MASDFPVCMVSLNLKKSNSEKDKQFNLIKYQVRKNTSLTPFSILLAAHLDSIMVLSLTLEELIFCSDLVAWISDDYFESFLLPQ